MLTAPSMSTSVLPEPSRSEKPYAAFAGFVLVTFTVSATTGPCGRFRVIVIVLPLAEIVLGDSGSHGSPLM